MKRTPPWLQGMPSGQGDPLLTQAARVIVKREVPQPGAPSSRVILPRGMRRGHSQARDSAGRGGRREFIGISFLVDGRVGHLIVVARDLASLHGEDTS